MCGSGALVGQGIGIFGRGSVVWAAAQQLCARFCCLLRLVVSALHRSMQALHSTYNVLVCALDALEACPVLFQLAAELLQALKRLFLLGLHRLLLGELAIVVDGARKRGEGGIELCLEVR